MVSLHVREDSNKEGWRFAIVGVIPSSRLAKLGEKKRQDFQSPFIVLCKINRLQEERYVIHRMTFDSRVKLTNMRGSGAVQLTDTICMHLSMLEEWNFLQATCKSITNHMFRQNFEQRKRPSADQFFYCTKTTAELSKQQHVSSKFCSCLCTKLK